MSKSKKAEFMNAKTFLDHLEATVQSLPTEEEKRAVQAKIAALADFLESIKSAVESMPTIESVGQVNEALGWLQGLFSKAMANPVLAGIVPAPRPPRPRESRQGVTEENLPGAKADVDALKALPVEEIRSKLLDEDGYSLSRIRVIASVLGIGAPEKLSRESLAHQVTTKIANYRGYERLSGKSENE